GCSQAPASGDSAEGFPANPSTSARTAPGTITAVVTLPGGARRTVAVGSSRSKVRCTYYYLPGDPEDRIEWEGHPTTRPDRDANPEGWSVIEEGETTRLARPPRPGELAIVRRIPLEGGTFLRICRQGGAETSRKEVYFPAREARVSEMEVLARSVLDEQPLPVPVVRNSRAYIHWPTWLAVEDWGAVEASAELAGASATAVALPYRTTWGTGDGATVTCDGQAPVRELAPAGATSHCTYQWRRTSYRQGAENRYVAEVTVHYATAWAGSDGSGGPMGELPMWVAFLQQVREVQAVNVFPTPR
ncbi:MAG: hypothetical protein ACRD0M_11090, partial [Acidimicrobiales bacterium]